MAGPVAEVLLKHDLSRDQALALASDATLGLGLGRPTDPTDTRDPTAIASVLLPCRHSLDLYLVPAHHERGPDDVSAISRRAGYTPAGGLLVVSWTRDETDARAMARLLVALADAAGGALVELAGALTPPGLRPRDDLAGSVAGVRRYVAGRPGLVIEVPYGLSVGDTWIAHLVDSRFLEAWLHDPDFHLPN